MDSSGEKVTGLRCSSDEDEMMISLAITSGDKVVLQVDLNPAQGWW